ncbi:MAG: TOBE domain-containing protein [Methanobacteriaceae archaeon]
MKISARNVIKGKVEDVEKGAVMANIKVSIDDPCKMTSVITKESAEELNLKEGDEIYLIIKSTEIMVGKD